tara:strand:+ start:618 stop:1424 length:807 start_codon:yes stop_codon:yes gene_type:complete
MWSSSSEERRVEVVDFLLVFLLVVYRVVPQSVSFTRVILSFNSLSKTSHPTPVSVSTRSSMASHRQKKASPSSCDDDDVVGSTTTTTTTRTYPFVRYAKSRKIQKGEDVERATVDARWTSKSVADFERNLCRRRRRRDSSRDDDDDDARLPANHHSVEFVFASLFDGHGGKECAQFCAEETLECLLKALDSLEAELNDEEKTRVVETNRVRRSDDEYTLKKISRISRTRLSFFLSLTLSLFHTLTHTHTLSHARRTRKTYLSTFSRRR